MNRKMGNFDVFQRTSDGMFNATGLLKQYNGLESTKKKREVADFLRLDKTKEFIEALQDEYIDMGYPISIKKGGSNQGTWMNPLLFIDFSMWLNSKFKVKVLKFVYDELIKQRHDAGDNYKMLSAAGVKLEGYNFAEVAKAMQWVVYGKTGKNLRQSATEEQLKEVNELQTKLAFAIDMGYITSYQNLLTEIRKIWKQKHRVTPF